MILHSTTVRKLLKEDAEYSVPIYQRNYDWSFDQLNKLLYDIKAVSSLSYNRHHFGVMYYFENQVAPGAIRQYSIVDGQQRITTISILFKSILDHITANLMCTDLVNDIKGYIRSTHRNKDFNKLRLKKGDNEVFVHLLNDDIKHIESDEEWRNSNIYKNYKYFRNELNKSSEEEIYEIFNNIDVLEISSHLCEKGKDDPQTIFQNINSSGKPLTQTNLIMNYSLQNMEEEEMNYAYESYWVPIEKIIPDEKKLEDFVRSFITILTFSNPKKKIYEEYKKLENKSFTQLDIIKSLHNYATFYDKIYNKSEKNKKFKKLFEEGLDSTSYLESFLLYLYSDHEAEVIDESEFIEILTILRNYVLRRNVYFSKSRDMTPIICDLMASLDVCKKERPDKYVEEFKAYLLLLRKDEYKIPSDIEVKRALIDDKYFYKGPYSDIILIGIERRNSKEYIDSSSLSIEHVLPQNTTISAAWKAELGNDYEDIKARKLHNIGNLTLTAHNSELGDKSFIDKKNMTNGLNDSYLKLNSYFKDIEIWNEAAIVKRSEVLSDIFNTVYPQLVLDNDILESYKNREIESIEYYDTHKVIYNYLIEKLDLKNVKKNVFSNKVSFDNYQIKFNKKSISISDANDDDNKTTLKEKGDVDRYLLNKKSEMVQISMDVEVED